MSTDQTSDVRFAVQRGTTDLDADLEAVHGITSADVISAAVGFPAVETAVTDNTAAITANTTAITALATNTLILPATNLDPGTGTNPPTKTTTTGGGVAWSFADGVIPILSGVVEFPTDWATYNADILWYNEDVGAGAVVWRFDRNGHNAGESINSDLNLGAQTTCTAGAQDIATVSRLGSGLAVGSKTYKFVRVTRVGNAAADNLGNAAAVTRIVLTKVS